MRNIFLTFRVHVGHIDRKPCAQYDYSSTGSLRTKIYDYAMKIDSMLLRIFWCMDRSHKFISPGITGQFFPVLDPKKPGSRNNRVPSTLIAWTAGHFFNVMISGHLGMDIHLTFSKCLRRITIFNRCLLTEVRSPSLSF